jgi:hypothetical protein
MKKKNIAGNNSAMKYFIFSLYLLITATSGHAQCIMTDGLNTDRIAWKSLSFGAENFFVTLNSDVHFEIYPAEEIKNSLIATSEESALYASGPEIIAITVQSVIDPLWGATEFIQSKAWCDINNMAALQRIRQRQGEKDWQKTYRFTNKGVFRLKEEPGTFNKTNLRADQKTETRESFYPYGLNKNECSSVLEPSEMFLIASLLDCSIGAKALNLCVFSKQKMYIIEVRATELKPLKVDYIETSGKNKIRRKKTIDSIKISFKIKSSGEVSRQNDEAFSFLGLYGDFDIYTDTASRIPVLVSGKVPRFDEIDLVLHSVVLK